MLVAAAELTRFEEVIEDIVVVVEAIGVAILVIGGIIVAANWLRSDHPWSPAGYLFVRRGLGRVMLLGLEVLVAADLIRTVTVDQTLESVAALGLLVIVRTVLSWSIVVELEGMWPWKVALSSAAQRSQTEPNDPPAGTDMIPRSTV
ncbi:MAG: DUF1622 domain-containing protein [Ilumatobacteraceae bacterium]